jgi:putative ABC transport system ATP-binding protein
MDLLRRLATDQQIAILVVTHDESLFGRFDRIFHLRDGRFESTETIARPKTAPIKSAILPPTAP